MRRSLPYLLMILLGLSLPCAAQENDNKPAELEFLKGIVGVWDAEAEVWPQGLSKPSVKFPSVETIEASGEYWLVSKMVSEFGGQKVKVHSFVGYDLDKKKLVGTIIDQGPYAAKMSGEYDKDAKSVTWLVEGRGPDGKPAQQKTVMKQISETERELTAYMPSGEKDEFTKIMVIQFTKRD